MGKREKNVTPRSPTWHANCRCPDPGAGSQLVNATCFLVPDHDARDNTVTHDLSLFRPGVLAGAAPRPCAAALALRSPRPHAEALVGFSVPRSCSSTWSRAEPSPGRPIPACSGEPPLPTLPPAACAAASAAVARPAASAAVARPDRS